MLYVFVTKIEMNRSTWSLAGTSSVRVAPCPGARRCAPFGAARLCSASLGSARHRSARPDTPNLAAAAQGPSGD